eukprot:scaffold2211_cov24-Tisochrysis_lutea.AAC.2
MKRWSQLDTRLLVALLPSTCVLGPHWKGSVTRWCRGLFPRCSHAAHASEQCQGVLKTDDLAQPKHSMLAKHMYSQQALNTKL